MFLGEILYFVWEWGCALRQSIGRGLRFWYGYGYGLSIFYLFLFVFRYFMGTSLGTVEGLDRVDVMFPKCMGGGCVYVLSLGGWFVVLLGFHLFVRWYLILVLWRGRFVFGVDFVF